MKPTPLTDRLVAMHSYGRPAGSKIEKEFIDRFLLPLGAEADRFGNYHVSTIENPRVLFSSHTDTVHRIGRRQRPYIDPAGFLRLNRRDRKRSTCLGADDTVGVFLCSEMVRAKVPGHYVFHFGEECGCLGSSEVAETFADWLKQFAIAIAFDRMGTSDIITHQCGARTASDAFARSFADQLNAIDPTFAYVPSDRGLYTDTNQYARIIPECTNISIGYSSAHTAIETVDVAHVLRLRSALLRIDTEALVVERDPTVSDIDIWPDDYVYDRRFDRYDDSYDRFDRFAGYERRDGSLSEADRALLDLELSDDDLCELDRDVLSPETIASIRYALRYGR